MRVLIFGATGMVGQGVLRECLLDDGVRQVLTLGRKKTGKVHAKLREIEHKDLSDFSSLERELTGLDACFFCLGVTSAGMSEDQYRKVTKDIAVAAAKTLVRLNPGMTLVFVSGAGADTTGKSRIMWARVKGEAENALLAMPFKAVYVFRPAMIQPLHGIQSRTALYRRLYVLLRPLVALMKAVAPGHVTTTEKVGKTMIKAARSGAPKRILESADINALAGQPP